MHHVERNKNKNNQLRELDDIINREIKQAELLAKRMMNEKITAIITSPYLRCKHTAEIINKYHNLNIIEDDRFNEKVKTESWCEFLARNIEALDDIVDIFYV